MAKLARKAIAHYVKPTGAAKWYLIGKDIDDMSVDMNGSFESTTNILGETSVNDTGYQPSMEVTPYYADPEDEIYEYLLDLAMNRKSGDDCKAVMLEAVADGETIKGWQEDCKIEITTYGGDTNGARIEFTLHNDGNRQEGTITIADKQPSFTAKAAG